MQTDNRLLDDLARLGGSALTALGGLRAEIEAQVAALVERMIVTRGLVTREEFDVVRDMTARARAENEALKARIEALERDRNPPTGPTMVVNN